MKTLIQNLLVLSTTVFFVIACDNNDVNSETYTTGELLIGSWNVVSAIADEPYRKIDFNQGDLILIFKDDFTIEIENNSTSEVPYPFNVETKKYELKLLCDYSIEDIDCDENLKQEYFVFDGVNTYQILQKPSLNNLAFGNDPMHQYTFHLNRINNLQ